MHLGSRIGSKISPLGSWIYDSGSSIKDPGSTAQKLVVRSRIRIPDPGSGIEGPRSEHTPNPRLLFALMGEAEPWARRGWAGAGWSGNQQDKSGGNT